MRTLCSLTLLVRASGEVVAHVDGLDHQHLFLEHDHAIGVGGQPAFARIDPARLQRAAKGARQSTGGSRDDVVEGGRMVWVLARGRAVVLPHLVVGSKHDRFGLRRQEGLSNGPPLTNDPNPGDVLGLVHPDHSSPTFTADTGGLVLNPS
jgi:hypothetical protein